MLTTHGFGASAEDYYFGKSGKDGDQNFSTFLPGWMNAPVYGADTNTKTGITQAQTAAGGGVPVGYQIASGAAAAAAQYYGQPQPQPGAGIQIAANESGIDLSNLKITPTMILIAIGFIFLFMMGKKRGARR
jgi:hypothetical protein